MLDTVYGVALHYESTKVHMKLFPIAEAKVIIDKGDVGLMIAVGGQVLIKSLLRVTYIY